MTPHAKEARHRGYKQTPPLIRRRTITICRRNSEPGGVTGGDDGNRGTRGVGREQVRSGEGGNVNGGDTENGGGNINRGDNGNGGGNINRGDIGNGREGGNINGEGNNSNGGGDDGNGQERDNSNTHQNIFPWSSLLLQNNGSVARDHLANERTYLAWIRTALMMMALALAFLQMYTIQVRAKEVLYKNHVLELNQGDKIAFLRTFGRPLGILAGVFSILVVLSGLFRYFSVQRALCRDKFPASRFIVGGMVVWCATVMILILVVDSKAYW